MRQSKPYETILTIIGIFVVWIISLNIFFRSRLCYYHSGESVLLFMQLGGVFLITAGWTKALEEVMSYKTPKVNQPQKECKIIISYIAAYLIIQWPILLFIRKYRFPLMHGIEYFAFNGYYLLFTLIVGLIIPLIWIWKNGYFNQIGLTKTGLYKSLIAITPLSFFLFLYYFSVWGENHFRLIPYLTALIVTFFSISLPEELLFRPLLQERLERILGSGYAWFLSAFVYAIFYFPIYLLFPQTILRFFKIETIDINHIIVAIGIYRFTFGLIMGNFWAKTKNLVGNIVINTLINTGTMYGILVASYIS